MKSHVLLIMNKNKCKDPVNRNCPLILPHTLKKSYKRPPHIFSSSSESKIRSIKINDHMNKPMSNSGSVSFCNPKCVILLRRSMCKGTLFQKVTLYQHQIKCHIMTLCFYTLIYLKVLLTAMMQDKIKSEVLLQ